MTLALDLDGTLVSCEPRQSAVLRGALARRGIVADLGAVWARKRSGATTRDALAALGIELRVADQVAEDWRRSIEDPFWLGFDSLLPGVRETLREMRLAGWGLLLVTARARPEWVPQELQRLGLAELVDRVAVVAPAGAAAAKAGILRGSGAKALFGDTESDYAAAGLAGIPFLAVGTGQRSAEYLLERGIPSIHPDLAGAWEAFRAPGA